MIYSGIQPVFPPGVKTGLATPGFISANRLPSGYIFLARAPGMTDVVGLSVSAIYAAVPVEHRSIYSADGVNFYDWPTILTNISESAEANNGGELIYNPLIGAAQYEDGTPESVLRRAYRYFGIAWPEISSFDALTEEQFDSLTEEQLDALGA